MSERSRRLARHATITALAAVTLDATYSAVFWLILGRDERRTSPHAVRNYALIIGQLSVEAALIVHLVKQLRKVEA